MKRKYSRRIATCYLVLNSLKTGVRTPSKSFITKFNLSESSVKKTIKALSKASLLKTFSKAYGGGVMKERDISDEEFQKVMVVSFEDTTDLVQTMKYSLKEDNRKKICSICEKNVSALLKDEICTDCIQSTDLEDKPRIARCGHPSLVRYFRCERCLPVVPTEYDDPYTVAQSRGGSYD